MHPLIRALRQGLIVSCQPVVGGPFDTAPQIVAFAQAAEQGGAVGLRIEGVRNVAAVRRATRLPIIGLVKRDLTDSEVRITPWREDVSELLDSGADIVAFDATARLRPVPVADLAAVVHARKALAMADIATVAEAGQAAAIGCELIGTTLSGYTAGETPEAPDLDLVAAASLLGCPVIAEGRIRTPDEAREAMRRGAHAVVVGSAITRPEHITAWFAAAVRAAAAELDRAD